VVDDAVDVPGETFEHLYLIASEALHNVEQHAGSATSCGWSGTAARTG